jgi:molecular chaperone GrpE
MSDNEQETGRDAVEELPRSAATENDRNADDPTVIWHTKGGTATVTDSTAAAADGTNAATDWQERFMAEQSKADTYFNNWQRAAADIANMRRRHDQERLEYIKQANATLIAELLPVLDSFDLALAAMPEDVRATTWVDGIVLVERQLRSMLERAGLSAIDAQGKVFDPNEHEAMMHEISDQPENTVTGELQRGYKLHDRVLRPARVKVAKNES